MNASIEVSAQFGGRDASRTMLPHFRALQSAAKGASVSSFPFPQLAFILRVDGEVNAYGQSGAGMVDIDRKGRYVSIDIGVSRDDLSGRTDAQLADFVAQAILASVSLLSALRDTRFKGTDWDAVRIILQTVAASYRAQF